VFVLVGLVGVYLFGVLFVGSFGSGRVMFSGMGERCVVCCCGVVELGVVGEWFGVLYGWCWC